MPAPAHSSTLSSLPSAFQVSDRLGPIAATTLAEAAETLPATSISGRLLADGRAKVTVTLDADAELKLEWSSPELAADPSQTTPATIDFGPGAPTLADSEFEASGTQVEAAWGAIALKVTPKDACGVLLGAGRTITFRSSIGTLAGVVDNGDGTYGAVFRTPEGECPETPELLEAEVEGVVVGSAQVKAVCSVVDPNSPVTPATAESEACASNDTFAEIRIVPFGHTGLPMAPGQDVVSDGAEPLLVWSKAGSVTDEETGETAYTLKVGSNRCGGPRLVPVKVNGVTLATSPRITFRCLPVGAVTYAAEPATAPADGTSTVKIAVKAIDTCGNPAVARPITLALVNTELGAKLEPSEATTADAMGEANDGVAEFTQRARLPARPPRKPRSTRRMRRATPRW